MPEDNKLKSEDNGFSFIQEQIVSKKKNKWKRLLFSFSWTILLASVFGLVAGIVFYISGPSINLILGKGQDKKTVEFPSSNPEDENNISNSSTSDSTSVSNLDNSKTGVGTTGKEAEEKEAEPVIIENTIKADLTDLENIYANLRSVANEANKSMVSVDCTINGVDWFKNKFETTKQSTGLILADNQLDLLILVNLDQIKDAKDIQVTFYNSIKSKARVQDYDSDLNLAVIAVSIEDIPQYDSSNIKPATLGESYSLIIGSPIIALGSPNGYAGSMEFGTITSKGACAYISDNIIDLFNTDITDNENSRGVIINLKGEVTGIITQSLKDKKNSNLNTVMGISRIKNIIASMVNNKERAYFGIKGIDMTKESLKAAGIENGISITEVEAGSPALKAGIQSGDIITTVNDNEINSMKTFYGVISSYKPKTELEFTVLRSIKKDGKEKKMKIVLGKRD